MSKSVGHTFVPQLGCGNLARDTEQKKANQRLQGSIAHGRRRCDNGYLPNRFATIHLHSVPRENVTELVFLNKICFNPGIQDPASVKPAATLADLGMDSLMAVDIKQSIERGYGLTLTNTEIQKLKFSELENIGAK